MTFKEYLTIASKRDIYDDGKDFDFETIFAREILRYAHDSELETKTGFFRHLEIMNADSWFVGFLGDDAHPYAFVVWVKGGGTGYVTAGSVANQTLQALVAE